MASRPLSLSVVLVTSLFAGLFACGDDDAAPGESPTVDGGIDGAITPPPTRRLVMTAPATPVVSNFCAEFSLALVEGAPIPFPAAGDVAIASDPRTKIFATEAECTSGAPPSNARVEAGATAARFFLRTAAEGPVTLEATASFGSGSLSFTPQVFLTIGQPDPHTVRQARGVFTGGSVSIHQGKLLLGDFGAGRIRIWSAFPTDPDKSPTNVLGWFDETSSTESRPPLPASLGSVAATWTDGTRLVAVDSGHHRVLVWNTFPTTNRQPADFALGQPAGSANLTSGSANAGGLSGSSMNSPKGVASDGTRLFVADRDNNRVLVWNTFPTTGGQSASFALGQAPGANNLTTATPNAGGVSGASLSSPNGIALGGGKLFVVDGGNARVLTWNTVPTAGGEAASFALGQLAGANNLTTNASHPLGVTGSSLGFAWGIATDGTRLVVTDIIDHRVLVWSTLPTAGGEAASFALGQPAGAENLTSNATRARSASSIDFPNTVAIEDGKLVVGDVGRFLVWSTFPTVGGQGASFAIGVPSGPTNLIGDRWLPSDAGSVSPEGAPTVDGNRMFLADPSSNRVLVWNTLPRSPNDGASFALGQPAGPANLTTTSSGATSATTLAYPIGTAVIGGKLFVADRGNHRVLVWNTIPTAPEEPASFALGQPAGSDNLTSAVENAGGVSASSMSQPGTVASDGTRVFVADGNNHRVLVWNTIPTSGGQPADFALGQPDLVTRNVSLPPTAGSLFAPNTVRVIAGRLFVADRSNHRVLVWNTVPTSNGQPADFALGQAAGPNNLTSRETSNGASAASLHDPAGIDSDGTTLYVADRGNHRVLVWSPLPTAGGTPATGVIGQPNTSSFTSNAGGRVMNEGFTNPNGIRLEPTRLLVSDEKNHRITIIPR